MKRLFKKLLPVFIATSLLLGITIPAFAQIATPDAGFSIDQVEVYRNYLEPNDQLYLITANIEYTTTPSIQADQAYLVRLMTAAGAELGNTTFYPYHDSGYDMGIASIYFSAAWAPTWNQPYEIHIQGNPTLHWLDTTATTAMDGALAYDGGIYTNETAESNSAAANDMTLLPAVPAVDDAYYFGSTGMFNTLTVNIGQQGNWTGTYTWEYWNGASWTTVSSLTDNTVGFTAGTGNYDVTYTCPSDWQELTVSGLNLYWLRFRVVTYSAIVTQPLGTQSWTNTLATPPAVETDAFSLWYDDGTVIGTQDQLTIRLRALATALKNDWGGTANLIETVAGVLKLTDSGEDYFTNSIYRLREACPNLFADAMTTIDFGEQGIISDSLTGGDDGDQDVFGVNWYAQTFTASWAYSMDGVWLKMLRVGSPGTVTISLRATAAGLPTGADLATGTLNGNNFVTTTTGEWENITFTDDYTLTSGSVYAIVARATTGTAVNYVGWRSDAGANYANGQACSSGDSGATWAAIAPAEDFMFINTGTDAMEMSYREQLANRLVGTRFDMTDLGNSIGLSRMWTSSIAWFLVATIPIAWAVARTTNSYKPVFPTIALLAPVGALAGFIYLEVAILIAFFFATTSIFTLFYKGAP